MPAKGRRDETLEYTRSMLGQLRTMAQAERCDMVAYLIEMAYVEVSDVLRAKRPMNVGAQTDRAARSRRDAA